MLEELGDRLEQVERVQMAEKLKRLLAATQQTALLSRVQKCIAAVEMHIPGKQLKGAITHQGK
jgi:hypothetical protein